MQILLILPSCPKVFNDNNEPMKKIPSNIVCCYLYPITKYGYPPPAKNTLTYLEEMARLGFQSVELEGIREEHLLQMYELRFEVKQKLDELNLSIPYFCVVLPGLSAEAEQEREKNLRLFEKGCEIAELFGARGVLDNGPLPPYAFPDDIPVVRHYDEAVLRSAPLPEDLNWREYFGKLVETYRAACDLAKSHNLSYHLHPCFGALAATTDGFLHFYDAVGRANLRFNLDTANQFHLKDNLTLALIRLAECVDYIHFSDNTGDKAGHLVPGLGSIEWSPFFETLERINFRGHMGIDVGGVESGVMDLDKAYVDTAAWLAVRWNTQVSHLP